jgi:hypothetical protein
MTPNQTLDPTPGVLSSNALGSAFFISQFSVVAQLLSLGIFAFMGIDLRWEDENGEQLAELGDREFLVARFLPPFDAPDFPCLRFVDPAGDTVFNQAQITQLIAELERLSARRHDPKVERHLQAVLAFVRQAVRKVHTYLKFYGD